MRKSAGYSAEEEDAQVQEINEVLEAERSHDKASWHELLCPSTALAHAMAVRVGLRLLPAGKRLRGRRLLHPDGPRGDRNRRGQHGCMLSLRPWGSARSGAPCPPSRRGPPVRCSVSRFQ